EKKYDFVFPIYLTWEKDEDKGFIIPPVYVKKEKNNDIKQLIIFPVVWYEKKLERNLTIFPLLNYTRKINNDKSLDILWKVFNYKKTEKDEKTNLLWKIYESEKKDNYIAMSFGPLIQYEKSGNDDIYWALVWRLFSYERKTNKKRIYFLYLFHNTWE
ncbi:MAG: hypothetical protein HY934_10810, partial [Candidatus Firestonebacteria bacterium]|nr:hypothetical protein [Candidatus Firestonebacteria bacterium]